MKRLPESPKKIVAGLKLYRRNPSNAPVKGTVASAMGIPCCDNAAISIVLVANRPTPAAKPSSPSMRLNAFIHAISQTIVSGKLNQDPNWCPTKPCTCIPAENARRAAIICPLSFCQGLRPNRSSARPVAKMTRPAGNIRNATGSDFAKRSPPFRGAIRSSANEPTYAMAIAIPPRAARPCRAASDAGRGGRRLPSDGKDYAAGA